MAMASIVKGIASVVKGIKVAKMINSTLVQSLRNVEFNFILGLKALQAVVLHCNLKSMEKAAKWVKRHITDFEKTETKLKDGAELVAQFRKVRYYALGHFEKLAAKIERAQEIIQSPDLTRLAGVLGEYDKYIEAFKRGEYGHLGERFNAVGTIIGSAYNKVNKAALVLTADP
eukprot:GHVS01098520.1.p1 GENE.GHVS01098520.1~~GHVS01098520.1.p1  ORF type:complete len:173 (-),score=3.61 GHVS01098520.1:41-559(-)